MTITRTCELVLVVLKIRASAGISGGKTSPWERLGTLGSQQ